MELMKKVNALVLGLAVLLAVGCGGDEPIPSQDPTQSSVDCRLTGGSVHHQGYIFEYVYNANGQVIKASRFAGSSDLSVYDLIDYNNHGSIRRIRTFNIGANDLIKYRLFDYDSGLRLKKETYFGRVNPSDSTSFMAFGIGEYFYNASNKVSQIKFYAANQPTILATSYTYTYQADSSLVEEEFDHLRNRMMWKTEFYFASTLDLAKSIAYFKLDNVLKSSDLTPRDHRYPVRIRQQYFDLNGDLVGDNTMNISYTFNSFGYPEQQFYISSGQSYLSNSWTYNCE